MNARRTAAGLTGAALVLTLAGCPDEPSRKPSTTRTKAPAPAAPAAPGNQHQEPTTGAQPAPVQGDPSAHNTQPGELDLYVEWSSENRLKPSCEWSVNKPGVGTPCTNIKDPQRFSSSNSYVGLWGTTTTAKSGDVVYLIAQGNAGTHWMWCHGEWKGQEINIGSGGMGVLGRHCGGTLTLP